MTERQTQRKTDEAEKTQRERMQWIETHIEKKPQGEGVYFCVV